MSTLEEAKWTRYNPALDIEPNRTVVAVNAHDAKLLPSQHVAAFQPIMVYMLPHIPKTPRIIQVDVAVVEAQVTG